jgi:CBS domain containing-hemolysin-like protein
MLCIPLLTPPPFFLITSLENPTVLFIRKRVKWIFSLVIGCSKTWLIDTVLGLKSLVSLHRAVDENGDVDALTEDEVTIIGAVLDLRAKPVSKIMTPIADCFVLSIDANLDEKVMDMVRIDNRLFSSCQLQ